MDVASLVQRGISGVVATLGTALTAEQAKLLKRYAPEVWVAYDGDAAGQHAILRALDIFESLEIPARVLVFPDQLDPDEFIRRDGAAAFEALKPLSAPVYRMQTLAAGLDLSGQEGRTQYAIACAPILRSMREPVEMENLLQRLMVETGFTREVLLRQIGQAPMEAAPSRQNTQPPMRDMLWTNTTNTTFMPDDVKAERALLSLMSTGRLKQFALHASDFSEPLHREIAEALLSGVAPSALPEQYEDPAQRAAVVEICNSEPQFLDEQLPRMVNDYLERMQKGQINTRIASLREQSAKAQGQEQRQMLDELQRLTRERQRLKSGRKE